MAKTLIGIFSLSIVVAIFVIPTPTTASDSLVTNPAASDSLATNPAATDPLPTNPAATDPLPTNPAATDPLPTNPAVTPSPTTATTDSKATGASTQTGTPPTVGSTTPPVTGTSPTKDPNATPTTPAPATTNLPSACASSPCLRGSTCEERANQDYICLCLAGDFYTNKGCQKAKVFPGLINWDKQFEDKMSDKTSKEFEETSKTITDELKNGFSGTGYTESLVLELRESKQSKGRSTRGNIEASVQVIFEPTAKMTDEILIQTITDKVVCKGCLLSGTYTEKTLCDSIPCDVHSTKCDSADGDFTCQCHGGFFPSHLSYRVCTACPPGQKYDGSKCVRCGFGYSGVNCKDNVTLILVIVSSILGGLLLIALILLPVVATKLKKKSSKSKEEDLKPYFSHSVAKAPIPSSNGFSSSVKESADGPAANSWAPRIPRAATSNNWDSRTNLEMTPSNSRQNLIPSGKNSRFNDSQDDMFSISQNRPQINPYSQVQPKINHYDQVQPKNNPYDQVQPQSSLYSQVQPKSNPYVQNRATNPYAQSRGQTNPYYN